MTDNRWRFINSGYADAYTNMAVDEAIMTAHREEIVPPTLRLYRWNPPAVSIGYFQKIKDAVNIEACRESGVDIVRRLTGGRAVLHQHELTYSVVMAEDYPGLPKSIVESYKFICMGIIEGLKTLGADVSMESGKIKTSSINSAACFDSASMYEVLYEGKKLVGSAQVRKNGIVLQHGSILIDIDIEKQISVLDSKNKLKSILKHVFENKVTTLKEAVGRIIKPDELEKAIVRGFEKAFEITGETCGLVLRESELVNTCLVNKFKSTEWTNLK